MKGITRRMFGMSAGAAAVAAMSSMPLPKGATAEERDRRRAFPEGFVWGCATAAYQSEGASTEDGRGHSIWDTFSHIPGKTSHGDTGDVADDSYHLYKEDARLLRDLGANAYRMSISWSRIFPDGTGRPNPKGMDHYERVVDELLANNVSPYITLFHWDLPGLSLAAGSHVIRRRLLPITLRM